MPKADQNQWQKNLEICIRTLCCDGIQTLGIRLDSNPDLKGAEMKVIAGISVKIILILALAAPGVVTPVVAIAAGKVASSAETLVEQTENSTALLIRAARRSKDPALQIDAPKAKPFWSASKKLNGAVTKMANGHKLRDDTFHSGLAESVSGAAAVFTGYEMSGASDKQVRAALERLEGVLGTLQGKFSKAAARKAKGGKLTQTERKQMTDLRAKHTQLERRLDKIEPKVRGNKRAIDALKEVRKRSRVVSGSRDTLGNFVAALVAVRIIDGILLGCHWWWGPWGVWYGDFAVDYVAIHDVVITDISYDWDYYGALEIEIEADLVADDIATEDLMAEEEFIEAQDIADEISLSDEDYAGLESPTSEDFADPELDLDESAFDEGIEEEVPSDPGNENARLPEEIENEAPINDDLDAGIEQEPLDNGSIETEDLGGGTFDRDSFDDRGFDDGGFDREGFDDGGFDDRGFDDGGFDGGGFDDSGFDDLGGGFDEF